MIFNYHRNDDEKYGITNTKGTDYDTPPPAATRAAAVLAFAQRHIKKEKNEERRISAVRAHIRQLDLQPSQINGLLARVSAESTPANLIVASAAKSMLVHVPLTHFSDVTELADLLRHPGRLSKDSQAVAERKMQEYARALIHGGSFATCMCLQDNKHLFAVEPYGTKFTVGADYFFRDPTLSWTGAEWVPVRVLRIAKKSILAKVGSGDRAFEWRLPIPAKKDDIHPVYLVAERFARPPVPRYVKIDTREAAPYLHEDKIVAAAPVGRVTRRDWYMIASGEGEQERLRFVQLEAASDKSLFVVLNAYEHIEIKRKPWRLYRIEDWYAAGTAPKEAEAAAISFKARIAEMPKLDEAARAASRRLDARLSKEIRNCSQPRAPRKVVIAANAMKSSQSKGAAQ